MTLVDEGAPLGVTLVGCGRIARMFHLPVLRDLPGVRLVSVVDGDEAAREGAARVADGARPLASLEEALADPAVGAVVVAVPTSAHVAVSVQALAAGRHVYVEKPLATTAEQAREAVDAWQGTGLVGAVGHNLRFHPQYAEARRALAGGALGAPVALRGTFCSAPRELPAWKRQRSTGGGALLDLAVHHIDLVRWLTGVEVASVSARVVSRLSEADTASLDLQLVDGPAVQLLATVSAAQTDRFEVMGSAATLHVDRMGRRRVWLEHADAAPGRAQQSVRTARALLGGAGALLDRVRPAPEPSFAAALGAFAAAARAGGGWTGATLSDGAAAIAVVEAAERSAATGTRVEVGT